MNARNAGSCIAMSMILGLGLLVLQSNAAVDVHPDLFVELSPAIPRFSAQNAEYLIRVRLRNDSDTEAAGVGGVVVSLIGAHFVSADPGQFSSVQGYDASGSLAPVNGTRTILLSSLTLSPLTSRVSGDIRLKVDSIAGDFTISYRAHALDNDDSIVNPTTGILETWVERYPFDVPYVRSGASITSYAAIREWACPSAIQALIEGAKAPGESYEVYRNGDAGSHFTVIYFDSNDNPTGTRLINASSLYTAS